MKHNYRAQWLVITNTLQSILSPVCSVWRDALSSACMRRWGRGWIILTWDSVDISVLYDWQEDDPKTKTHHRNTLMAVVSLTHDLPWCNKTSWFSEQMIQEKIPRSNVWHSVGICKHVYMSVKLITQDALLILNNSTGNTIMLRSRWLMHWTLTKIISITAIWQYAESCNEYDFPIFIFTF